MSSTQPALDSGSFTIGGSSSESFSVHRMGFGAMQITGQGIWGPPEDHDGAIAVLRRAVELGVDFIDTADSYGPFVSEELIREALYPYGHVRIATKAGLTRPGPGEWRAMGAPDYLRECAEMSLRRLGVETIDLFQLHRIDSKVPFEDQLGVFVELVAAGKVLQVGLSEVSISELQQAQQILPIATVQNLYNVANRESEAMLEHCAATGIGFIPWFPIATGALATAGGPLAALSERTGISPSQLALAWLLRRSPVMLPIPGTKSVSHLEENCAASLVTLDDATYAELEALAAP